MPRMLLIVFVALALGAISVPSLFASPAQRSLEFMNSPISPLHPQPGSDGDHNDDHDDNDGLAPIHWRGPVASGVVWVPQADSTQMWIKTHQVGVGWWDADGQLHAEQGQGIDREAGREHDGAGGDGNPNGGTAGPKQEPAGGHADAGEGLGSSGNGTAILPRGERPPQVGMGP